MTTISRMQKGWAETCGFKYMSAKTKEEFTKQKEAFLSESSKPIVFEVFTSDIDDAVAYHKLIKANSDKDLTPKTLVRKSINKIKNVING